MRARLQDKLELWNNRLKMARKELRRLRAKLIRSKRREKKLAARISELEELTTPRPIPGHTYPAQMVAMAIFMVAQAGVSLRGTAKSIAFFAKLMGWQFKEPSHVTVLRWVLRAGLYELRRSAAGRGDDHFVGILDESISLGGEKLLLLLGVRLPPDGLTAVAALTHADIEVLAMQVSPCWKAEQIGRFLTDVIESSVAPTSIDYIVSDGGPNIVKALRDGAIDRVGDCTHVLMNLVKK